MDETLTDNQNSNYRQSGPDVLDVAQELKAALDDFRKAVQEAVDQRRQSGLQKSVGNTSGKPTLRKFPVRIREPAWVTSREAILLLRVSLRTLRRYRKQQLFTYKTVNGAYRYRHVELVEFMKNAVSNTES